MTAFSGAELISNFRKNFCSENLSLPQLKSFRLDDCQLSKTFRAAQYLPTFSGKHHNLDDRALYEGLIKKRDTYVKELSIPELEQCDKNISILAQSCGIKHRPYELSVRDLYERGVGKLLQGMDKTISEDKEMLNNRDVETSVVRSRRDKLVEEKTIIRALAPLNRTNRGLEDIAHSQRRNERIYQETGVRNEEEKCALSMRRAELEALRDTLLTTNKELQPVIAFINEGKVKIDEDGRVVIAPMQPVLSVLNVKSIAPSNDEITDRKEVLERIRSIISTFHPEDRLHAAAILFSKFECSKEEKTDIAFKLKAYDRIDISVLVENEIPKYVDAPEEQKIAADAFLASAGGRASAMQMDALLERYKGRQAKAPEDKIGG